MQRLQGNLHPTQISNIFTGSQLAIDMQFVDRIEFIKLLFYGFDTNQEFLLIVLGPPAFQITLGIILTAFIIKGMPKITASPKLNSA